MTDNDKEAFTDEGLLREVDRSREPKREPGPINLQRYEGVPAYSGILNPATRIHPFNVLKVVDYGDAAVDPFSIENSMGPIRKLVREIAQVGAIPIVLGGDHSILWPDAAAIADVYGAGNVGVIHLDAHSDCSPHLYGHLVTHGTPIRRLIEDEHIPARNFVQVGLRSVAGPDDELLGWMRKKGMRSHFMAEIVGGLTNRELLPAIRRLCHETPVVGMEVVEVAPLLDHGSITTMNARGAILEGLTGLAMRKMGVEGPGYLDPVTSGQVPFALE